MDEVSEHLLTTDELLKDPEGAALVAAMQTQIADQLQVTPENVAIQGMHPTTKRGGRLAEYTVGRLHSAHEAAKRGFVALDEGAQLSPLPVLRRSGYYTVPSMQELAAMPHSALRAVRGFRVGRVGFGEVSAGAVGSSGVGGGGRRGHSMHAHTPAR